MAELSEAQRIEALENNEGWFGRASKEFRSAVLSHFEWRSCLAGRPIYLASDESVDLFGIAQGTVDIYSRFASGDNPLLHLAHEGQWLGYGCLLSGEAPRITVIARTSALLAHVRRPLLQRMMAERPEWWRVIGTAALEYGDTAVAIAADLMVADNARRTARTLLRIAGLRFPRRTNRENREVSVTQDELAALANMSRSTLVQVLSRLESEGLVLQGYRALRILDLRKLELLATEA
jgi:CRP-like cAMP-binding protein